MSRFWPPATATGLGSLPLDDPAQAAALVLGEVADLPYLPELPGRGLGADMIGRTASLLVDVAVEWQLHGWTIASRAGRDAARARDFLRWDTDAFVEAAQGVEQVKLQVVGPVTLAASMELPNLHKVLTDHGAFADVAASLAEGVHRHVEDWRRLLPGAEIVLQVDEPMLPLALSGRIPTPSGYGTVRSLSLPRASAALAAVLSAVPSGAGVLHCCAAEFEIGMLESSGAAAVSIDASLITTRQLDGLGEFIDGGGAVWLGVLPGTDASISAAASVKTVTDLWQRWGFASSLLAERVAVTPTCGLAGGSAAYARRAMAILRDVAKGVQDASS